MRVAIVGTRESKLADPNAVRLEVRRFIILKLLDAEIVSGGASGVDSYAIEAAKDFGNSWTVFDADWDTYGKGAGPLRNTEIAKYVDRTVAFWDGKSTGTLDMIRKTVLLGKPVIIIPVGGK